MTPSLIQFIDVLFGILTFAILARVIFSWIRVRQDGPIFRFINEITEPIFRVARKITPKTGMLDLSPIVALVGIDILHYIVRSAIQAI